MAVPQYHFYPRSPYGERPIYIHTCQYFFSISIHALLTESDYLAFAHRAINVHFYPRSPYGERRRIKVCIDNAGAFLSTLSLRRATGPLCAIPITSMYFYPRSPYGERPCKAPPLSALSNISIHALLTESDHRLWHFSTMIFTFLSTLSLRRATAKVHKTVEHFCAYETTFMGIASSC